MPEERNIGEEILDGLRQIKRGEYGRVTSYPPIDEIRKRAGLSQARFAELLGISEATLLDWEQGRCLPSGAAWTLLRIAERRPEVLRELA
ncbi:MAG: helix-turn-helix domain-containing protein [Gammaproteobacteria bacterium]